MVSTNNVMISTTTVLQYLPGFAPYSTTYKFLGLLNQTEDDCSFVLSPSIQAESTTIKERVVHIAKSFFEKKTLAVPELACPSLTYKLGDVVFKCPSLGSYKIYCDLDRPWDVAAVRFDLPRRKSAPVAQKHSVNSLARLLESSNTYINESKLFFRKRNKSLG